MLLVGELVRSGAMNGSTAQDRAAFWQAASQSEVLEAEDSD